MRTLLLLFLSFFMAHQAAATHIRAGEITVRRLDPQSFTYEITLRGYADTDSQVIFGSNGTLDFGDGTSILLTNDLDETQPDYIPRTRISEDTWMYEKKFIHTYPSARSYTISFREFYRNEGILNMDNSVNMPFYIETVIIIDPFLGVNNTPELLVPPVDKAAVGKLYIHNPGAYDIDGDSISYRLVLSKQDRTNAVANYRYPHVTFPAGDPRNGTSLAGGAPTLTLDSISGDLVWDTPGTAGEYNVAFYIEEWRKIRGEYYYLGYVTRDMQIIVEDTDNEPPVIEIPEDICVVAGERIDALIKVTDPDGDNIDLTAYGGVFELGATFTGGTNLPTPHEEVFSWQTECTDVRRQPYQVVFRATDVRGGSDVELTDIKTWNITVVAPPPAVENLTVNGSRAIEVDFDPASYACPQANVVQVWRREGSVEIPIDTCITGMPPGYGYELAAVRGFNSFPFVDDANGAGLKPGATYCYRFVAVFPEPTGGQSLVSEEMCITLPAKMPLITNVSILDTDETAGEILVRWIPGPDLAAGEVTEPHRYDLYRAEGFAGGDYTLVAPDLTALEFVDDTGLNTKDLVYNYYVMLKDAGGAEIDSSSTASTVRLTPVPGITSITLQWQAEVPWSNRVQDFPLHTVYRNQVNPDNPDEFVEIAQVNVLQQGFTYVDDGADAGAGPLSDDIEYCYRVVTSGSYSNPAVPEPLLNNSQEICSYTRDEIPPCPPLSFALDELESCEQMLSRMGCDDDRYENTLSWTANTDEVCGDDLDRWLIYYSPDGVDYTVVGESRVNSFTHVLTGTMAGYYYIQAVDRSGNLSEASEIVMRDNCPNYWLPNVITRNDDGINDVLRPPVQADFVLGEKSPSIEVFNSRCPRFVQAVHFKVYNRWGKQVYEYNSDSAPEPDIY
ncbi:MAG: gliding motility-associated C-terminal domain-containing protein, partial [Bacteroidetes bacterium]|nr:gliding motility-associated C-terminal domain-containing protein [Bacteroidota bacterium]